MLETLADASVPSLAGGVLTIMPQCKCFHVGREGVSQESMGEQKQRSDPCRLGSLGHCRSLALAKKERISYFCLFFYPDPASQKLEYLL
jgi:hypothetical protein